jgi:hypothetical protein
MNKQLVQIINRGLEQGLTPLALAARIELAIKYGEIDVKPAPIRTLQCVDCGHLMEAIKQGEHTIVTCKHKHCTLYGVTLSTDQYAALTPLQLDGYRNMVASFKERHHE